VAKANRNGSGETLLFIESGGPVFAFYGQFLLTGVAGEDQEKPPYFLQRAGNSVSWSDGSGCLWILLAGPARVGGRAARQELRDLEGGTARD